MDPQGRKIYHSIGGAALLSVYFILGREPALLFYGVLFAVVLVLDIVRLKVPAMNRFVFERFGSIIREREGKRLTGTPPYLLGIGLSFFLFSPEVAAAGICFLAFGDVAAAIIGQRFGRTKIWGKSLEGTAAFIVAATTAGFLLHLFGIGLAPWIMLTGALVAAVVELLPIPVNDNLVIPVVSGGVMELLLRLAA
jgi:acyl phosphate:glycerol-3-phosphate acyltransferase